MHELRPACSLPVSASIRNANNSSEAGDRIAIVNEEAIGLSLSLSLLGTTKGKLVVVIFSGVGLASLGLDVVVPVPVSIRDLLPPRNHPGVATTAVIDDRLCTGPLLRRDREGAATLP